MTELAKGYVYRLMLPEALEAAHQSGSLPWNADDVRDGFFHLSAPDQVIRTASRFYAAHERLAVVAIPESALADALKWEGASDHGVFPHYYGHIDTKLADHHRFLIKQSDGSFVLGDVPA